MNIEDTTTSDATQAKLADALYESAILNVKQHLNEAVQAQDLLSAGHWTLLLSRMEQGDDAMRLSAANTARALLKTAPINGLRIELVQ